MGENQKLVSVGELTKHLGVGRGKIYYMIKIGRIPYLRLGKHLKLELPKVEAALKTGTREEKLKPKLKNKKRKINDEDFICPWMKQQRERNLKLRRELIGTIAKLKDLKKEVEHIHDDIEEEGEEDHE